jgi:hypothetical protein
MIFSFFLINLFVIILINRIKIKASIKIILFFISIFIFNLYVSNNIIIFFELLILLVCSIHLSMIIYAIKHSSIRIEVLNSIIKKKN